MNPVGDQLALRHAGELWALTADKGYDCNWLREDLRKLGIRALIKHCINQPYDHAHNAQIAEDLYGQRSMAGRLLQREALAGLRPASANPVP